MGRFSVQETGAWIFRPTPQTSHRDAGPGNRLRVPTHPTTETETQNWAALASRALRRSRPPAVCLNAYTVPSPVRRREVSVSFHNFCVDSLPEGDICGLKGEKQLRRWALAASRGVSSKWY